MVRNKECVNILENETLFFYVVKKTKEKLSQSSLKFAENNLRDDFQKYHWGTI